MYYGHSGGWLFSLCASVIIMEGPTAAIYDTKTEVLFTRNSEFHAQRHRVIKSPSVIA